MNIAGLFSLFVLLAIGVSVLASKWFSGFYTLFAVLVGDALVYGGIYCAHILLDKRPIRLKCRNCQKIVLSNTPWVCATCKRPNRNTTEFPFVHHCEYNDCRVEPKAYKCHHCGDLIFLSDDQDKLNYAYRLNSPSEAPKLDKRSVKSKTDQEKRQDEEQEIAMARYAIMKAQLDERLNEIRKRSEVKEPQTELEMAKKDLKKFFDSHTAVHQAAREQKLTNAKESKGDERKLQEDDAAVDKWVQGKMQSKN